jgi:PEP-CTERM motif
MTKPSRLATIVLGAVIQALGASTIARATPILITIDTSGLVGSGALAFDFVGNGTPPNTVTLSAFTSDGTLGASSSIGNVAGALPGTLTLDDNGSFFNEYLTGFSFGSSLSFVLNTTNIVSSSVIPDEFSFFLLDATGISTLVSTSDPTGADSLLTLDLDGAGNGALSIFSGAGFTVTAAPVQEPSTVPEPASLCLLLSGLAAITLRRRNSA